MKSLSINPSTNFTPQLSPKLTSDCHRTNKKELALRFGFNSNLPLPWAYTYFCSVFYSIFPHRICRHFMIEWSIDDAKKWLMFTTIMTCFQVQLPVLQSEVTVKHHQPYSLLHQHLSLTQSSTPFVPVGPWHHTITSQPPPPPSSPGQQQMSFICAQPPGRR